MRISHLGLIVVGGLAVSGCAYGSYGRYGGLSVGYSSGYGGYGGYGYGYPYGGYGYGSPYWGWYDSFYYPGTGFYVYDRYRRPYYWNDRYRRYWTERRAVWQQRTGTRSIQQPIWEGFSRNRAARNVTVRSDRRETSAATTTQVRTRSEVRRSARPSSRDDRPARRTRPVVRDDEP